MEAAFVVYRFSPEVDAAPRSSRYHLDLERGATVLAALLRIQDEYDGTLAFRYSCRGAICGSCAMVMNGAVGLACRTQVSAFDLAKPIVLEPLPNLEVVRDLVVDMRPFWAAYRAIEPWLQPLDGDPAKERLQGERDRERLEPYVNCILCASCYGACPVLARNERYMGAAALAALWRFIADTRDARDPRAMGDANGQDGVWGCHSVLECVRACPKNIRPAEGIVGVKRRLLRSAFARKGSPT